jgi:hypothetical protein
MRLAFVFSLSSSAVVSTKIGDVDAFEEAAY